METSSSAMFALRIDVRSLLVVRREVNDIGVYNMFTLRVLLVGEICKVS